MEKKLSSDLAQVRARFPRQQPIRVMFQDEARFGRISDSRRCWCKKPLRPLVKAMLTHEYVYAYAAVSPLDGRLDSLVLPHVNALCMQLFIDEVASRYPVQNIIMVVDGAGWHKAGALQLPDNLRLHFLPPYSPELNPQEHIWDELREKHFHNRVFGSLDALEDQLIQALKIFEEDPQRMHSIAGWDWIINSVSNEK
ncbi:IS630 family transposase [Polaromonas glacialis]|uniref:IS630 family transposase n=1 Tax=Polaromonas glacialis TaxID=866564 RepID=UPI001E4ADC62|nr:IS630 family transposase [Polaromonas glacialis]